MKSNMESNIGIKKLSIDNYLKYDISFPDSEYFVSQILAPQLSESVPSETRVLFEVARGTLVYGQFFYPLLTLGIEQLYRVCEHALRIKIGHNDKTFNDMISLLQKQYEVSEKNMERWHQLRYLRNSASHPNYQSIYSPGITMQLLTSITEQINSLFN